MAAEASAGGGGSTTTPMLLERDRELHELDQLTGRAARGTGAVALIAGPAGIGKSRLLAAAAARARESGFEVLQARGGELERELGWAVVRELFARPIASRASRAKLLDGAAALSEPVLSPRPPAGERRGRPDLAELDPDGALHGLYWLTSNLAERRPLALLVDDAQWADPPSVRWLSYLAARIEDLPAILILAHRQEEGESSPRALAPIAAQVRVIAPAPLSEGASAELIGELFGQKPEAEFARACFQATAGNPFLLRGLALELVRDGARPTASDAPRVAGARPEAISRFVLLRLLRLPPAASELARAVAVLGSEASLTRAATLVGLTEDEAYGLADSLAATQILAPGLPLRFAHPIVRTMVYEEIPAASRARLHERASRLLHQAGAEAGVVAMHLLATEPRAEPRTVELLAIAARDDLARGIPESAAAFLRRAVEEGAAGGEETKLLRQLGAAEARTGDRSAVDTLREAVQRAPDPRERGLAALELGRAFTLMGRLSDAVEVLQAESERIAGEEPELSLRLESELLVAARLDYRWHRLAAERLEHRGGVAGKTPAERQLLAALAFERASAGAPAAEAAELAERALAEGLLLVEETSNSTAFYEAVFTLIACERFGAAIRAIDAALEDARRRGSISAFYLASAFRCLAGCRGGSLAEAESDGRTAVAAVPSTGSLGIVFAWLGEALIERDELDEAEQVLRASGLGGQVPENILFDTALYARGKLRIARGDTEPGVADLLELGKRLERLGGEGLISVFPYRSQAALGLGRFGERQRARELVAGELELARAFGAPRALGVALHATGVVEGGSRGVELLREAVAVLEDSESPLERSRAVVELGAATRRESDRVEARELLRRGLDLAHRCGATAIERRARDELRVAGARPRRELLAGPESLTASERRVAQMAAHNLTNREIAQKLFVSLRTVETHLTHSYAKLEIGSRRELAVALRAGEGAEGSNDGPAVGASR